MIKEILKVALLSILVILLVVILIINLTLVKYDGANIFMSTYWLFYVLIVDFFIYIFIYLLVMFHLFKNKIIQLNYITVLLFTLILYISAEFFTAKNERIDSIVRSILIILSCSSFIYYFLKKWIKP